MAETTPTRPDRFSYQTGFISETEEHKILYEVGALNFSEVRMHGVVATRRVLHFGWTITFRTLRNGSLSPPGYSNQAVAVSKQAKTAR